MFLITIIYHTINYPPHPSNALAWLLPLLLLPRLLLLEPPQLWKKKKLVCLPGGPCTAPTLDCFCEKPRGNSWAMIWNQRIEMFRTKLNLVYENSVCTSSMCVLPVVWGTSVSCRRGRAFPECCWPKASLQGCAPTADSTGNAVCMSIGGTRERRSREWSSELTLRRRQPQTEHKYMKNTLITTEGDHWRNAQVTFDKKITFTHARVDKIAGTPQLMKVVQQNYFKK